MASRRRLALLVALGALAASLPGAPASAGSWQLSSAFGRGGVAGLPLREHGAGTLLARGPQGSLFVGGYANRQPGSLLVTRISAAGRLVRGFGEGGVLTVPAVHAFAQDPPRLLAPADGGVLVVGLDGDDDLVAVRLSARGALVRSFGHDGVARYALSGVRGFAVITAAAVEPDGDLVAVYQHEVPQPVNEPGIPRGLGEGPIELVRLLPSGARDGSFGHGGALTVGGGTPVLAGYPGSGLGWACATTLAADGSILLAYEQAVLASGAGEAPAVQMLDPAGADAVGFGSAGAVFLPVAPKVGATTSSLCDGLFALPGGAVEASFGGEGPNSRQVDLFRFTAAGAADGTFDGSGHATLRAPVAALAVGAGGETFSAGTAGRALVVGGTLANGRPDPALGSSGKRFAVSPSPGSGAGEPPTLELLAGASTLVVRVGEELVRLSD